MKKLESSFTNMVIVLTIISVIAGGTLAYINKVTQEPIAEINAKNLQDGIKKVILGETEGTLKVEEPIESEGYLIYHTDKGTGLDKVAATEIKPEESKDAVARTLNMFKNYTPASKPVSGVREDDK